MYATRSATRAHGRVCHTSPTALHALPLWWVGGFACHVDCPSQGTSGCKQSAPQQRSRNSGFMYLIQRRQEYMSCCFLCRRYRKKDSRSSLYHSTLPPLQRGAAHRRDSRRRCRATQAVILGPTSSFADMHTDVELARLATLGATPRATKGAVKALAKSPTARASAQVAKTFMLGECLFPVLLRRKCLRSLPLLLPASGC